MEKKDMTEEFKAEIGALIDAKWKVHVGHKIEILLLKDPTKKDRIAVANICDKCHKPISIVVLPIDYIAADKLMELEKQG